ncbi:MAG: Gfo/Idh/MocA family protein [Actinomycetota bacterium]
MTILSTAPIGVAVVGGGHWGPHLIRNFHDHTRSRLVAVAELRTDRREALAERFAGVRFAAEAEKVIDDPEVDAVVIATPTSTHFRLVRHALEAGKHVLVEKPLADRAADARELCELADSARLHLMVGHVFLFNPAVVYTKTVIERGELGDLYYLSMLRTNLGPVRVDVDAAWDLASHDVSIANFWLGAAPVAVSARGGSWLNPGIDDAVFATLDYPSGVIVHIHASWLNPRKSRFISVTGSRRMLTVNDMDLTEPVRIYDKRVEESIDGRIPDTFAGFRAQIRDGEITIPLVAVGEPLRAECDEFLSRLLGGGGRLSDGWEGLAVVRVLEAITVSTSRQGALVSLEEVPG